MMNGNANRVDDTLNWLLKCNAVSSSAGSLLGCVQWNTLQDTGKASMTNTETESHQLRLKTKRQVKRLQN